MNLKLENEGMNIVSAFDPQVRRQLEKNTEFWKCTCVQKWHYWMQKSLDEVAESVLRDM